MIDWLHQVLDNRHGYFAHLMPNPVLGDVGMNG